MQMYKNSGDFKEAHQLRKEAAMKRGASSYLACLFLDDFHIDLVPGTQNYVFLTRKQEREEFDQAHPTSK